MQIKLPTEKVNKINHLEAGKRIRAAREKAGKSLRWLAHELGITPPFLSDLELGRRNWSAERFQKAVEVLNELN